MTINDDILYKIDSEIGKDKKVVELQREIERLNRTNNEIFKANETLFEEIKKLQNQLQQKENIIKEAREKIHDIWFKIDFTNMTSMSYVTIKLDTTSQGNELLEILDKVGDSNERNKDNK